MLIDANKSPHARAAQAFRITGAGQGLVSRRREACRDTLIPHVLEIFEDKESFFHQLENFKIAAGESDGEFRGNTYGDGDFYKLMEGCVYAGIDVSEYIALISRVQQPDGYLSSKQIIAERKGEHARHADQDDFEEYNFGHMFTAACAHYRLTGETSFINIARRVADYLLERYRRAIADKRAMTAVCPSHYMGLIELYRATGEQKYLQAATMAIELRDYVEDGRDDNQDAIKLLDQRAMHGHAVRATYLYAGVADLYLETGDTRLLTVLNSCWENMITTKLYVNGGLGAIYSGASPFGDLINSTRVHQAFGYEYQLPNITAYNETCASLGGVFWAARMFMIDPNPKYFDFIERATYNLAFAAVNVRGDKYFYENMLRRTQTVDYFLMWPRERKDDFRCFCCPTNISRYVMELPEYAFMTGDDCVYAGLYMSVSARFALKCGAEFTLTETTDYPWDGRVKFEVSEWNGVPFKIFARVPEFAGGGFREFAGGDCELEFDMTPKLVIAHSKVEECENHACVMRGPLLYCIEAPCVEGMLIPSDAKFEECETQIEGERVIALKTKIIELADETGGALYSNLTRPGATAREAELIPYFMWDNRGFQEMRVWIPLKYNF